MSKPLTAWSYSRYRCWETCPLQAKFKYIDKLKEPTSKSMERGDRIHKGIANWLKGSTETIPHEAFAFKHNETLLRALRDFDDKIVEEQWGFTRSWEPTGWFGDATWFRQSTDAAVLYEDMVVEAIDWKTGKKYGTADDQAELTALAIFCHFKPAVQVDTRFVYLDTGEETPATFHVADLANMKLKWAKRAEAFLSDTTHMPRPGDHCRRCHFSRSNNGPCRYG